MSRFTGGVPLVWVVGMLVGAGLTAAASVLIAYRVSPVGVACLPLVALGFWAIQRHGAQAIRTIQKYGGQRYRVVGLLILLLLCLPLGRLTPLELGSVPISPVTALVSVVTVVWLWRVLIGSEKIEFSHMQLPLVIFLLWGIVGIYGASDAGLGFKVLFTFAMGASVYLVTSQSIRSPEEARVLMWAVAITAGIIGLYTILTGAAAPTDTSVPVTSEDPTAAQVTYTDEQGETYVRSQGIFGHPNLLGGFLALAIPAIVALTASESFWGRRMLGYLLFIAATLGLVFSYSRGAWIGTGVGLLVLLPVLKRSFWPVLGLLGLGLTGVVVAGGGMLTRFQSIITAENDPSVSGRPEIWDTAVRLVEQHPLLGVGLGNFQEAYESLLIPNLPLLANLLVPGHAHNLFLNLAVEAGLVGAAAFAWLLAVAFLRAWQVRRFTDARVRIWSIGLTAGLVAMLVQTFVDIIIYQGFINILLFTYLGMMDAFRRFDSGQVEYEHTPLTAPASSIGRAHRSTPSTEHTNSGRNPVAPVRYPLRDIRKTDVPFKNPLRGTGLGRARTEDISGDESDRTP